MDFLKSDVVRDGIASIVILIVGFLIREVIKRSKAAEMHLRFWTFVETSVLATKQKIGDKRRELSSDGSFSDADAAELNQYCKDIFQTMVIDAGPEMVVYVKGLGETYIGAAIEAMVAKSKK